MLCSQTRDSHKAKAGATTTTKRPLVAMAAGRTTPEGQSATRSGRTKDELRAVPAAPVTHEPRGLVARLRSKLCKPTKCEKCRRRSTSCRPNASFLSGRKHYLCENCRVSADNVKNLYTQMMIRNPHFRFQTEGGDVIMDEDFSASDLSASSGTDGCTAGGESGYGTATSSDSVGSEPSGVCDDSPVTSATITAPTPNRPPSYDLACSRSRILRESDRFLLEQSARSRVKDSANAATEDGDEEKRQVDLRLQDLQHRLEEIQLVTDRAHAEDKPRPVYDGYLETSFRSSKANVRVLKGPTAGLADGTVIQQTTPSKSSAGGQPDPQRLSSGSRKNCANCHKITVTAFRLPWEGAWLCEDCMDDMI